MYTFKTVEDYFELMSGLQTSEQIVKRMNSASSKSTTFFWGVQKKNLPISLARYDVRFVNDLAKQVFYQNLALTDRQYELAVKIVRKYERQLSRIGVKVPDELPSRQPLRECDKTRSIKLVDDTIQIKFPFDNQLIDQVKTHSKHIVGSVRFENQNRIWILALTEPNLVWAVNFGKINKFDVDSNLIALEQKVLDAERTPYAIELDIEGDQLVIRNASTSMLSWLQEQGVSLTVDNVLQVAHYNQFLGFTISPRVKQALAQSVQQDEEFVSTMFSKDLVHIRPGNDSAKHVFEYAQQLNKKIWFFSHDREALNQFIPRTGKYSTPRIIHINDFRTLDQYLGQQDQEHDLVVVSALSMFSGRRSAALNPKIELAVTTEGLVGNRRSGIPKSGVPLKNPRSGILRNAEKLVYYCNIVNN